MPGHALSDILHSRKSFTSHQINKRLPAGPNNSTAAIGDKGTTMKAMQLALSLGMDRRILIDTPLMWIDKAETWALAQSLGGSGLVQLILEHSHTCYLGNRSMRHDWGLGCGTCPACELRASGWQRWRAQVRG